GGDGAPRRGAGPHRARPPGRPGRYGTTLCSRLYGRARIPPRPRQRPRAGLRVPGPHEPEVAGRRDHPRRRSPSPPNGPRRASGLHADGLSRPQARLLGSAGGTPRRGPDRSLRARGVARRAKSLPSAYVPRDPSHLPPARPPAKRERGRPDGHGGPAPRSPVGPRLPAREPPRPARDRPHIRLARGTTRRLRLLERAPPHRQPGRVVDYFRHEERPDAPLDRGPAPDPRPRLDLGRPGADRLHSPETGGGGRADDGSHDLPSPCRQRGSDPRPGP